MLSIAAFCITALVFYAVMTTVSAAGESASGEVKDASGKSLGKLSLTQDASGAVQVSLQFNDMPPGQHGIHFHAVGKCDGPDFMSAAAHYNPENKKHGLKSPEGAHGGDLPNLVVPASGQGIYQATTKLVTLSAGPTQLITKDGSALIVHANADDETTDPTGNSGGRIACAVVSLNPGNAPSAPAAGAGGTTQNNQPDYTPWIIAVLGLGAVGAGVGLALKRNGSK